MIVAAKKQYRRAQCIGCADGAARLDFFVVIFKALFGGSMGVLTGSVGLHAVALLASGDVLSKGINWLSVFIAKKPATARFPYGYGKVQFLSALLIGVLLVGGATFFFFRSVQQIQMGQVIPPKGLAILAALLLALTSEIVHRILRSTADCNNSAAIRAAAADNRVDAISSVMVLIGTFLAYNGWVIADHLMALGVMIFVVKIGWGIVSEAVQGLLDFGLPVEVEQSIRKVCAVTLPFDALRCVYGRRIGDSFAVDLEIELPGDLSLFEANATLEDLKQNIHTHVPHIETVHATFLPRTL